jgi:hypothetical protein
MNVDGKRIRMESPAIRHQSSPRSGRRSPLRTIIWNFGEPAATDLGCPRTNDSRQEKRPKLGSLGLELAGCPDKLFTNYLVAGLPAWVGQQLFFHSYRRNLAQL